MEGSVEGEKKGGAELVLCVQDLLALAQTQRERNEAAK